MKEAAISPEPFQISEAVKDQLIEALRVWFAAAGHAESHRELWALDYLRQSIDDANSLSLMSVAAGEAHDFAGEFLASMRVPNVWALVHRVAEHAFDERSLREVITAHRAGRRAEGLLAVCRIREFVRDGYGLYDVRLKFSEEILQMVQEGDVAALRALTKAVEAIEKGELTRKGAQPWILRAWLPCAIWQCGSAHEAEQRLRRGWDIMVKGGVQMPPFPDGRTFNLAFEKVARSVGSFKAAALPGS